MEKILIVSATLKSNYSLAKELERLCIDLGAEVETISLENFALPLYTDSIYEGQKDKYIDTISHYQKQLTDYNNDIEKIKQRIFDIFNEGMPKDINNLTIDDRSSYELKIDKIKSTMDKIGPINMAVSTEYEEEKIQDNIYY